MDPETTAAPKEPQAFVAEAQTAIKGFVSAVGRFFEAHPNLESDAAKGLQDAADTAAPLAEAAVNNLLPPSLADVIDAAITKEQADADASAQRIQANAAARIETLQELKANTATPAAE
jgi:hypothetical protein